jgi:hypothetical protein
MYSTCLFCHGSLGANDVIERFPIGSRLAFDSAKGRLWVICPACGRWNLTPLEERWEAVEDCERRFRAERLRQQTTNIGLVRLASGLQLIRIGKPLAPEFAAWRYGQELGRRFRRAIGWTIGGGVAATALIGGFFSVGVASHAFAPEAFPLVGLWAAGLTAQVARYRELYGGRQAFLARPVRVANGTKWPYAVYAENLAETALVPSDDSNGWGIALVHGRGRDMLTGDVALRALGVLLARVNRRGGSASTVARAANVVTAADTAGYPSKVAREYAVLHTVGVLDVARGKRSGRVTRYDDQPVDRAALPNLPADVRLALEMSIHEHSEQRAIDGELAELEAAWREAEEIAAIADDLFLPDSVTTWMAKNRRGV